MDQRAYVYAHLAGAVGGQAPLQVFDRLYFSELVYGPVWRGKCAFDIQEQEYIKRILLALKCPLIMCLPKYDVVQKNVMETKQMDEVSSTISKVWERYLLVLNSPDWRWRHYDYTHDNQHHQMSNIRIHIHNYMSERRARTWQ
jgi:hypothetical protein